MINTTLHNPSKCEMIESKRDKELDKLDKIVYDLFDRTVDEINVVEGGEPEAQIDKMLYKSYGLGEEEIRVVEGKE